MTDLTQDWQDGKLKTGMYYVGYKDGRYGRANLILTPDFYGFFNNCSLNDKVVKVLAEVPDYIAWQNMWNTADMEHKANTKLLEDVERLEKENKELEQTIESQKQTNLVLIKRLEEKVTNVKEALDFLQAESSELSI